MLANAAGWALGSVISKFKTLTNVGFSTFSEMYHSHVVAITDYSAGIWRKFIIEWHDFTWGYAKKLQFWQFRWIWVGPELKLDIKVLRFAFGISWYKCQIERLKEKVFHWNYEIGSNWSSDIKGTLYEINMQEIFGMKGVIYLK